MDLREEEDVIGWSFLPAEMLKRACHLLQKAPCRTQLCCLAVQTMVYFNETGLQEDISKI